MLLRRDGEVLALAQEVGDERYAVAQEERGRGEGPPTGKFNRKRIAGPRERAPEEHEDEEPVHGPEHAVVEGEENHQEPAAQQAREGVGSGRAAGHGVGEPAHRGAGEGDLRQVKEPDDAVFELVEDHNQKQPPPEQQNSEQRDQVDRDQ